MSDKRIAARVLLAAVVGGPWCLAVGAEQSVGKIEAGKPKYADKPQDAWQGRGRIVGVTRDAPAFTVTVLDAQGKEVKKAQVAAGGKAYEVEWLVPGVYTMRVSAEGFAPLTLEKLEVRANADLRIDLEFTR